MDDYRHSWRPRPAFTDITVRIQFGKTRRGNGPRPEGQRRSAKSDLEPLDLPFRFQPASSLRRSGDKIETDLSDGDNLLRRTGQHLNASRSNSLCPRRGKPWGARKVLRMVADGRLNVGWASANATAEQLVPTVVPMVTAPNKLPWGSTSKTACLAYSGSGGVMRIDEDDRTSKEFSV